MLQRKVLFIVSGIHALGPGGEMENRPVKLGHLQRAVFHAGRDISQKSLGEQVLFAVYL
jgi:hypothetical protein